jgi:cyclophilin family peptidyl-prolyl cis-trans isomerase
VPNDKRQRQKQARREAQERQREALIKANRRRTAIRLGVIMIVIVGLLSLFGILRRDGGDEKVATDGGVEWGTTECPPAGGADERRIQFDAPFEKCIVDGAEYTAVMKTDVGDITIELFPEKAPLAVNNMVALARYQYYDGVPFHRVIKDFVIQGGDAEKENGQGGPGYTFADELPEPSEYGEGSLAMANSGPNTNGSQFFIVTSAKGAETLVTAVGGSANYTLFGKVVDGMEVVKAIEADAGPQDTPAVLHKIESLTIKEKK